MEDQVITTTEPTVVEADTSSVVSEQTTTTEPTVVESANTATENTAGLSQVVESPTVVDQATPMDSNTTYSSLEQEQVTPLQQTLQSAIEFKHNNSIETNNATYMDKFLNEEYDYDKNEAGTYWVAGAINDVETQMGFLNTLINEEMYDEMDLQKHFYDTNLATARAYAAQKNREVAYGFYQAAQEKALAEAELTGWYMPAEGAYMLGQYNIAESTLKNKDATSQEISKANRVINTVEKWFGANQISSRGIKCLNMMNYEESVRHNTIMGELKAEGNRIAAGGAAAQAAMVDTQIAAFLFDLEELELTWGHNFSKEIGADNDDFIGHDVFKNYPKYQALQGYDSIKGLMQNPEYYAAFSLNRPNALLKQVLGNDYAKFEAKMKPQMALQSAEAFMQTENWNGEYFTEDSGVTEKTSASYKKDPIHIRIIDEDTILVGTFNDKGEFNPITDGDTVLDNGKTVNAMLKSRYGESHTFKVSDNLTEDTKITIDGTKYSIGKKEYNATNRKQNTSPTNMSKLGYEKAVLNNFYNELSDKARKTIDKIENGETVKDTEGNDIKGGLTSRPELIETNNLNEYIVYSKEDSDGNTIYYTLKGNGELKRVDKKNIIEVGTVKDTLKPGDEIEIKGNGLVFGDRKKDNIGKASYIVGYDPEKDETYMVLARSDESKHAKKYEYYTIKGNVNVSSSSGQLGMHTVSRVSVSEKEVREALKEDTLSSFDTTKTTETTSKVKKETPKTASESVSKGGGGSGSSGSGEVERNKSELYSPNYDKYMVEILESQKIHDSLKTNKYENLSEEEKERINSILGQGGEHQKKGR